MLLACSLAADDPAWAEDVSFRDPEDGAFDVSDYLLNQKGVFPVPMVTTEPAIGYGGGAMLLYFSESFAEANASARDSGIMQPPNITGIGGGLTENGTWMAALGHFRTWGGDRFRYLGALARINLVTDYYGLLDRAREYELDGDFLMQQLLARVGDSRWYFGLRYSWFDSEVRFTGEIAEELGGIELTPRVGKGGFVVDYDSRDNIFFPGRGTYAEFEALFARDWLGSSRSFETYAARAYKWIPMGEKWNLALRIDAQASDGDIPFYAQPSVSLRGLPRGRIQDQYTLTGEIEGRWNVRPRWYLLAFGGIGRAWGRWKDFDAADDAWGAGVGFRYLIARKLGMTAGMDFATSEDDNAFYIQVGSAWR